MGECDLLINGGYFVFKRSIFDYIKDGEELVQEPFHRLIQEKRLMGYAYDGFWKSMDTFKEKQELDDLRSKNRAPWELWKRQNPASTAPPESAPEKASIHTYPLESAKI